MTYLIDAMPQVIREYGPVQFLLIGDGPLMGELRAQVDRLGMRERIHFAGFQADYVPYMEAMDIGVMPSLWEGFSISMQEYMALGKPMVVTNHGSFLEALTHEQHGLIVATRDSAGLSAEHPDGCCATQRWRGNSARPCLRACGTSSVSSSTCAI